MSEMSSRGREVELTISKAKHTKNVNWRYGPNKAYAVVWVDPRNKCTTRVDEDGDTSPFWNERLFIRLSPEKNDDDEKIYINIVHAGPEKDTKALIGSASLKLIDVLNEVGFGVPFEKTLKLKRPSGRPQGKLDVTVTVLEPQDYHPPPQSDYSAQHAQPQYPYRGPAAVGYSAYEHEPEKEKKKESSFGGIAISEGSDTMEENDADDGGDASDNGADSDSGDDSDGGDDSD